ncbi:MAG: hypothetical protein JWN70_5903 [Planctomycetaceae bacterium]|nr:hypothetical protein [Planctomycetaceae bacterium]
MADSNSDYVTPPFAGIATFGRQPHTRNLTGVDVAVVGIPYDGATSYRSGTRFGPRAIREQSLLLWGYNNALQVAPFEKLKVIDYGDVDVIPVDVLGTHAAVEREVGALLAAGCRVLALGGDHSLALPLLRAHHRQHGPLAVVHFDAHPDTWDEEFPGRKVSHGTPFRRAIDEGLIDLDAYLQIGIRGPTPAAHDYEDSRRLGARMITLEDALALGMDGVIAEVQRRVGPRPMYLTFDIDAVDPAFAPGTGTPEVGGFSSREVLQMVRGLRGLNLVGCDLVEVSPPFDSQGITAILAANLAFEFLSLMAIRKR